LSSQNDPLDPYFVDIEKDRTAARALERLDQMASGADHNEVRAAVEARDVDELARVLGTDVDTLRKVVTRMGEHLRPIARHHQPKLARAMLKSSDPSIPGPDADDYDTIK